MTKEEFQLAEYQKLHDMLSDAIEGGRLSEADIPDDYQALVDQLARVSDADIMEFPATLKSRNEQRLLAAAPVLLSALVDLAGRYVGVINSDYCHDPEKEPEVKAARAAIAQASRHHPPMILSTSNL